MAEEMFVNARRPSLPPLKSRFFVRRTINFSTALR